MKTLKTSVIAASLAFSMAYASSLSKDCMEEFTKLPETKDDFNMATFMKNLPPEVIKVKAQLKLPLGKPADNKMTDIGITVGCLKQFPESVGAIAPMLKDLSLEMTKNKAASKFGIAENKSGVAENSRVDTKSVFQNSFANANAPTTATVNRMDVIYMRDGQEVKDAVVIEIGIDEVKYKVKTRTAVYIVKKSNVSSILHVDGAKDFFCNGNAYNSETHFCHTDNKTYSCGNKPYNPATQSCYNNNQIFNKCGDKDYNPLTHFCHTDNKTYSCGNKPYNPATHLCHANNAYSCDGKPYNPEMQFCDIYGQMHSCGNKPYNPFTHFCHTDASTYSCGNKPYNPATQFCYNNNQVFDKCSGNDYDPLTQYCPKICGDKPYNPATHICDLRGLIIKR